MIEFNEIIFLIGYIEGKLENKINIENFKNINDIKNNLHEIYIKISKIKKESRGG